MWQSYLHKEHVAKKLAAYKKVAIPFKQGVFQFSIYNFKKILSPLRGREGVKKLKKKLNFLLDLRYSKLYNMYKKKGGERDGLFNKIAGNTKKK